MSQHIGPRTISAIGGSIKRVGPYRIHTFPSELVTDGLVLNLDAGDPRSYPSSGTTWTDLSGNGNNGTFGGGTAAPTYNNGSGGYFEFDGVDDLIIVNSSDWGSGSFSISMWFNPDSGIESAGYKMLLGASGYGSASESGIGHYLFNNTIRTWVQVGNNNAINIWQSSGILSSSTWYNLILVRDYNNSWKWYLNGSLINTYTSQFLTESFSSSASHIGAHYNSPGFSNFDGNISNVQVHNRALSPAEVAQNYDALRVRYGSYTSTFTPICAGGEGKVEVLCVAGGGGGAVGGGGAGGLIYNSAFAVDSNSAVSLSVGAGGRGAPSWGTRGQKGGDSTFSTLTSSGGGAGSHNDVDTVQNGGSGGGGGYGTYAYGGTAVSGQGNIGGDGNSDVSYYPGGGGGGAGGAGGDAIGTVSGNGGSGLAYSISGTSQFYAGGGGGATQGGGGTKGIGGSGIGGDGVSGGGIGLNGVPNTGSGGGGGGSAAGANGSNGAVIVRYPATDYNVEVLVVGGGGAGGGSITSQGGGGGGGAAGLLYYSSYAVSSGKKITVTVGKGGIPQSALSSLPGGNGDNSIFDTLVAFGGGGGSIGNGSGSGQNGGSGGGGGYRGYTTVENGGIGVAGQGNNGGGVSSVSASGGGGGGAGGVGLTNSGSGGGAGGNGGPGLTYSISGSAVTYAAGGKGGFSTNLAGSSNTGNGGSGTYAAENSNQGYAGGSGIVIIAYKGPQRGIGGVVDTTSRPGYTLHKFTTVGTDFFIP